jgi:hypothetical protein
VAFDLYVKFMADVYGLSEENCAEDADQNELAGLLWFWAELSKGFTHLEYNPAAEQIVDRVFEGWAKSLGQDDIIFSDDQLRVIAERVRQRLVIGLSPQMKKLRTLVPPRSLRLLSRQVLAGLLWVHGTELTLGVALAKSKRDRWAQLNRWRP